MKKIQEKSKLIQNIQDGYKLPLKLSYRDGKHQVSNSRGKQPKYKVSQWQKPYSP
jgi:hypothetical protein